MSDIKIFVSTHKDNIVLPDSKFYYPVQVGSVLSTKRFDGMHHDDEGVNISEKNKRYCELTTQYWAWKNIEADYYGFCHYRRYFSFSKEKFKTDINGSVLSDFINNKFIEKTCNNDASIESSIEGADFIVSQPWDFSGIKDVHNVWDQYIIRSGLHKKDIERAIEILKELYPEFAVTADEFMSGHFLFSCNMFIMKKELFHEYCEWLFPILDRLDSEIDYSDYSVEATRTIGHVAERLLGIFYTYKKNKCPELKTRELQKFLITDTDKMVKPIPTFTKNNVAVLLSFSNIYVPFAAVTLQSIIESSSPAHNYDLIVFHSDIEQNNQNKLEALFADRENYSIRFINISSLVDGLSWVANAHISIESFYRLMVGELLSNYERVLYLDSDLIILHDIAELFYTEMHDNSIAAVVDVDHAGQCGMNELGTKEYTANVLNIKDVFSYFQAGVLLLDVAKMNAMHSTAELLEYAQRREYMFMDQDILNANFNGNVEYLDYRWNVLTDCLGQRIKMYISNAPKRLLEEYMSSRENPLIIHYAGNEKPWNNPEMDFGSMFWTIARNTPFYETLLFRMSSNYTESECEELKEDIRVTHSKIIDTLFPLESRRRAVLKKVLLVKFWKRNR